MWWGNLKTSCACMLCIMTSFGVSDQYCNICIIMLWWQWCNRASVEVNPRALSFVPSACQALCLGRTSVVFYTGLWLFTVFALWIHRDRCVVNSVISNIIYYLTISQVISRWIIFLKNIMLIAAEEASPIMISNERDVLLVRSPLHYSKSVVVNVLYFLLSVYFYLDLQGGMFFS